MLLELSFKMPPRKQKLSVKQDLALASDDEIQDTAQKCDLSTDGLTRQAIVASIHQSGLIGETSAASAEGIEPLPITQSAVTELITLVRSISRQLETNQASFDSSDSIVPSSQSNDLPIDKIQEGLPEFKDSIASLHKA